MNDLTDVYTPPPLTKKKNRPKSNLSTMRCLKGTGHSGNCQRPVFSLGVFQNALNNKSVKSLTLLVIELAREQ